MCSKTNSNRWSTGKHKWTLYSRVDDFALPSLQTATYQTMNLNTMTFPETNSSDYTYTDSSSDEENYDDLNEPEERIVDNDEVCDSPLSAFS